MNNLFSPVVGLIVGIPLSWGIIYLIDPLIGQSSNKTKTVYTVRCYAASEWPIYEEQVTNLIASGSTFRFTEVKTKENVILYGNCIAWENEK